MAIPIMGSPAAADVTLLPTEADFQKNAPAAAPTAATPPRALPTMTVVEGPPPEVGSGLGDGLGVGVSTVGEAGEGEGLSEVRVTVVVVVVVTD